MEYSISTYRNEHGYWVAVVDQGEFKNLRAWGRTKNKSMNILKSVLLSVQKQKDVSK